MSTGRGELVGSLRVWEAREGRHGAAKHRAGAGAAQGICGSYALARRGSACVLVSVGVRWIDGVENGVHTTIVVHVGGMEAVLACIEAD